MSTDYRTYAVEAFVARVEWPSRLDAEHCVRIIVGRGGDDRDVWLALRSERHLLARVAATIHDETRTSATDARWVDLRRVSSPRRGEAMTAAVVVMGMIRDEWQT